MMITLITMIMIIIIIIIITVIVKKSFPKNLSADCRSTVGRQVTDSLPTANQQVTDRLRKKKNCVKNEQLT